MKPTKGLLYLFTFIATTNFINNSILIPILTPLFLKPEYNFFPSETTFSTRAFLLGLTLASYFIAIFIGSPIAAKICDSAGRKKILMLTTFVTALGNLITALGINYNKFYLIILGRLLAGITGGSSTPIKAIISDISDATNRNKNFSYISLSLNLSNILGPLLGSELAHKELVSWFNFSTPLFFLCLVGLMNLPLILIYIKETLHEKSSLEIDLKSSFTQIKKIFSIKEIKFIMVALLFYTTGHTIFYETFQTYLIKEFNVSSRQIGTLFSYMGCVSLFTLLFIYNPVAKYLHAEKVISYALIIYAFSMLLILSLNHFSYIYFSLIITLTACTFIQTLMISCISAAASPSTQGKFHAYHRSVQALGELSGPIFGGILVGSFIWMPLVFSALLMILAWLVVKKIKN